VALCIGMMVFMMRGGHGGRSNYALDILKERFARGEITKAEYEERRRRWKSEHFKVYCAGRASERSAVLEIAGAVVTVATDQHGAILSERTARSRVEINQSRPLATPILYDRLSGGA